MFKFILMCCTLLMNLQASYAGKFSAPSEITDEGREVALYRALRDCEEFLDFQVDYLYFIGQTRVAQTQGHFLPDPVAIKFDPSSLIKNTEFTKTLVPILSILTSNIATPHSKEEMVLSHLLDKRFEFINSRRDLISDLQQRVAQSRNNSKTNKDRIIQGGKIYAPTLPKKFEALSPSLQFMARCSTDIYQFLNRLILRIWPLVDPRTLSAQTKLKIRASTTLWANLTSERDYLGHPDEAILTYEDEDFPYKKDWENYNNYISLFNTKLPIELAGWGKKVTTEVYDTPYGRSLWDKSWEHYNKIPEAPYPHWLKPFPKKEPTAIEPSQQSSSSKATKEDEAPITPAMVSRNNNSQERFVSATETDDTGKIAQEIPPQSTPVIVEATNENKSNALPATKTEEVRAIEPSASEQEIEEEELLVVGPLATEPAITTSVSQEEAKEYREKEKLSPEPVRPRGMRLFHSKASTLQNNKEVVVLRGTPLSTHAHIFDLKQFRKVTFGQFKTLWEHICGKKSVIETTGSSHKKLIGPNGEVFGTFAHSDGMTYSDTTIKYIRDALTQIGYGYKP